MKDEDSRKLKSAISGILIVDKPSGMTSHDVVAIIRKGTGLRRIGHTGTLDPRASGVLVILIGPAVRLSEYLVCDRKGYEAMIRFGSVSDTYDGDGNVIQTGRETPEDEDEIIEAMDDFVGEITQVPPAYSAIKIHGQKAYDLARKGEDVVLEGRKITVFSFDFIEYVRPELTADIICSSGTYIRSIAHDLGQKLGCGAYLSGLRRTMSGKPCAMLSRWLICRNLLRKAHGFNTLFRPRRLWMNTKKYSWIWKQKPISSTGAGSPPKMVRMIEWVKRSQNKVN